MRAVQKKMPLMVETLISKGGDINVVSTSPRTLCALICAIKENDKKMFELLLNYGADPNIVLHDRDMDVEFTPFSGCIKEGKTKFQKMLTERNAKEHWIENARKTRKTAEI